MGMAQGRKNSFADSAESRYYRHKIRDFASKDKLEFTDIN